MSVSDWPLPYDELQAAYEAATRDAGPKDDREAWTAMFRAALPEVGFTDIQLIVLECRAWQGLATALIADPAILERVAAVFRLIPPTDVPR